MNLDKHPLLKECHEVMTAIEECGASTELTIAVTKAGNLMSNIEKLVDQITEQKSEF